MPRRERRTRTTAMLAGALLAALVLLPTFASAGRAFDQAELARAAGDHRAAAALYKLAANAGDPRAAHWAGTYYEHGVGVGKDRAQALRYFRIGAEGGVRASMMRLARAWLDGDGVPRDCERARHWIDRATGGRPPASWRRRLDACEAAAAPRLVRAADRIGDAPADGVEAAR